MSRDAPAGINSSTSPLEGRECDDGKTTASVLANLGLSASSPGRKELAIVDSGAQQSIFNNLRLFDPKTMTSASTVVQGIGSTKVVNKKGMVDIIVQCPETEKEIRWRFFALYCPSCPANLISLSATGDGNTVDFQNSKKGWTGRLTITSPDGKTHTLYAKERLNMQGLVCVEVLRPTFQPGEEMPETPDEPGARSVVLPEKIRVDEYTSTALSSLIVNDGTRGVQELEEDTLSRLETERGANGVEEELSLPCGPCTPEGKLSLREAAYERACKNGQVHATLGHFQNVKKLKQAAERGMITLPQVSKGFYTEPHATRCLQCNLTNTREAGITHRRVATSSVKPFAHFKCDLVFVSKTQLSEVLEHAEVLGHVKPPGFLRQEALLPKTVLLVVDVCTRMAFSETCDGKSQTSVRKAMDSILDRIQGVVADMRILTKDDSACSVHKFSGDDDRSMWSGIRESIEARRGFFAKDIEVLAGNAIQPAVQVNNMAYAQAASNGINEANGRTIRRIWRSISLQSSHIYLSQYLMLECYHHATRLANILPKEDENGTLYTPYHRLSGGTARGDMFHPFGVIGFYIDQQAPKSSPLRRRPCVYLSTLLEIPRPGGKKRPHCQYVVMDWILAQSNPPQHWKKLTMHASFTTEVMAPKDFKSAFKKYSDELQKNLAPIEATLPELVETVAPIPQQPVGPRPPLPSEGTGGVRPSGNLAEIDESNTTRGGVADGLRREMVETRGVSTEKSNRSETAGANEVPRVGNTFKLLQNGKGPVVSKSISLEPRRTRSAADRERSQDEKGKKLLISANVAFVGVARLTRDAPMIERLAEENEDRTVEEVFNAPTREITGKNARRDVLLMDLESDLTKLEGDVEDVAHTLVNQVFTRNGDAKRVAKPSRKDPVWKGPFDKELMVLEENNVFSLVEDPGPLVPKERINCIQAVRDDGSYRARICFDGSNQDVSSYTQTASPVAPSALIRMVFAICAARGKPPRGGDFSAAYLQVPEEKDIYARVFKEYKDFKGPGINYYGKVLKLNKKLYGAKSSGLGWYDHLSELLQRGGFSVHPVEPALFVGPIDEDGDRALLMTVVDDFVVSSSEKVYLELVKHFETNGYTITGKGITERFAGLNVEWNEESPHVVKLRQSDKLSDIVDDYGDQPGAKARHTPINADYNVVLDKEYEPPSEEIRKYRSLLGKLMHPAVVSTLPISFATSASARVMSRPKPEHYQQLLQTVGYLKNRDRKEYTLKYDFTDCPRDFRLYAFSDASFADGDSSKSTVGFVVCAGGAAIHWKSGLMTTVATSTASSERDAAFRCGKTIAYYTHILDTVGFPQHAVRLFCDNKATITGMLNCTVDSQRRHERVATAWLHDICVKRKYIQPFYVESKHNIADVMTKACVVGGRRAHEALLLLATGHHEGSWIDWIRKLTEAPGAFQKNDNLVKLEDYHNEVRDICNDAGVLTSNLV